MTANNPFTTPEGARRYERGRPFHHPRAVEKILSTLGRPHVRRALDVACGTGLSAIALSTNASFTVGVDSVESMVRLAPTSQNISVAVAEAENLPFSPHTFELVTVSSGVHWFDQETFFTKVARVLEPNGWLAIYDHFFEGSPDEPAIDAWLTERYEAKYPAPPGAARPDRQVVTAKEFVEIATFEYDDPISFTQAEFVAYLLSQSNTITAATQGQETLLETERWLREETADWFGPPPDRTFLFRGAVQCLQRKPWK